MAPMVGLASLFAAGCMDSEQEEASETADALRARRTDVAQAIGALTATVRRELFEMRQEATD